MRLERIELRLIRMSLVHPFETSFGRETERECIIVAVHGQGLVGWGECVAMVGPWYSYETTTTAWHVLRDFLIPSVLGQEIGEATEIVERFAPVRGHNMAKAGLEVAVWDLLAKEQGVSLAHLLGGPQDRIEVGVSIGIQDSLPALIERIAAFWEEGYRRVKIKIKPGWDRDVVAEVRRAFPDIPLMVDANSAYTLADVDLFKALDEYDLMMIEQPLGYDDIFDHARLQQQIETPICLDESIHSPEHARWALELGSCRVINIKAGRVGGLTQARRIHDLCQEWGVPVWCGGMLETGIGRAANVALASLPNFRLPGDLSASARYYAQDLIEPPFVLNSDGTMTVPQGPGIGVTVDGERLEEVTIRREVVCLS
jgi:O-succinylbenzoate synthase